MNTNDGGIHFETDLDNKKINAAIDETVRRISGMSTAVVNSGKIMDQAIEKTTKTQKEAIKQQTEFIKGLISEIKELERAASAATPGLAKKSMLEDLKRAQQGLIEGRADLNRLQNETITQNKEEETSQNKIVESLKKWGIGLFTVGAALKIAKDIINSTEGSASKFDETVALVTGGLQGLYRTMVTGTWDQLINNIVNAAKATRDLKIATSELEHITAGGSIKRADLFSSLEKARVKAAGTTDPAERAIYLNEAIDYQKQITELNVGEIKKRLAIDEDYYFKLTGHSKEYYDYLLQQIPNIAKNYETFYNQQEGYQLRLNQLKYLASTQSGGLTKAQEKERHELQLMILTLEDYKVLQEDLSKKGQWDEYIKGIAELHGAAATGEQALVYLTRQAETAADKSGKAEKKLNDLQSQITKQITLLEQAVVDGNTAEIKAISDKIVVLQKELDVRTEIAKAALLAAYGGTITPIKGLKAPTLAGENPAMPGLQLASAEAQKGADLGKDRQWNVDDQANDEKKKKSLEDQLRLREEIVRASMDLTMELGKQIGLGDQEMQQLGAILDTFGKLAAGDTAGAAITMLAALIEMIPTHAQKFAAEIEHINQLIDEQNRLIQQSERFGGGAGAMAGGISANEQQKKATLEEIARLEKQQKILGAIRWVVPVAQLKYSSNAKEIDKLKQQLIDIGYTIEDAQQKLDDFLRGGITENIIADSIAQGFRDGKTSVDDFGNYMNTVLLDAVMNIFKGNILDSPLMKDYLGYATQALSDNVLSQDDIDILNKKGKEFSDSMKPTWDALAGGLDMTGGAANAGLSGAISRSITEDTASELTGLWRRSTDDTRQIRDYSLIGVNNLIKIESNTMNTVLELQSTNLRLTDAVVELKSIVTNTKKTLSTDL